MVLAVAEAVAVAAVSVVEMVVAVAAAFAAVAAKTVLVVAVVAQVVVAVAVTAAVAVVQAVAVVPVAAVMAVAVAGSGGNGSSAMEHMCESFKSNERWCTTKFHAIGSHCITAMHTKLNHCHSNTKNMMFVHNFSRLNLKYTISFPKFLIQSHTQMEPSNDQIAITGHKLGATIQSIFIHCFTTVQNWLCVILSCVYTMNGLSLCNLLNKKIWQNTISFLKGSAP